MRSLRPKYYSDTGRRYLGEREDVPENLSNFNVEITDDFGVTESPRETHESRSERSQSMDEKFNAPITLDVEKWRENPNRLDLPGVDTIPYQEERGRGRRFAEKTEEAGRVDKIKEDGRMNRARGRFKVKGFDKEIWLNPSITGNPDVEPRFREGPVIAHEAGHAIDYGDSSTRSFDLLDDLRDEDEDGEAVEEVRDVSRMMRGEWEGASRKRRAYRDDDAELVADFYASLAVQPRATRREAPNATPFFEDRLPF